MNLNVQKIWEGRPSSSIRSNSEVCHTPQSQQHETEQCPRARGGGAIILCSVRYNPLVTSESDSIVCGDFIIVWLRKGSSSDPINKIGKKSGTCDL